MTTRRTTPPLPALRRGDPWTARDYDLLRRKVESLERQLAERRQIIEAVTKIRPFLWKSSGGNDHWICREYDYYTGAIGAVDVKVAKPVLLRMVASRPGGAGNITFTYTDYQERVADDTTQTETQIITPSYTLNDTLWCVMPVGGTGVYVSGEPVIWLDLNADARAWAKQAE